MATKENGKKTKRKGRNKKATQQNTEAKENDTNAKAAQQNSEENDGNNADATKENVWKRFVITLRQWVYPTFEDTAKADHWTTLRHEIKVKTVKNGIEKRKRIPIFNTEDLPGIKGVNYLGKEVQGKCLIIPGDMQKNGELEKKLMLAYENACKVSEWLANRLHNKRKGFFLFIGFSVSFSLLLQRVGDTIVPIHMQSALKHYLVAVCVLAIYHAWLLLADSEHKTKGRILPALGDHLNTDPFLTTYEFLLIYELNKDYSNYLISHTEQLTIKFFDLKQRSSHNDRIFTNYFYSFVIVSFLLLLCTIHTFFCTILSYIPYILLLVILIIGFFGLITSLKKKFAKG